MTAQMRSSGGNVEQGFELMLAGIGTVFLFLILLVGVVYIMAAVVKRFEKPNAGPATNDNSSDSLAEIAIAIAAATAHGRGQGK